MTENKIISNILHKKLLFMSNSPMNKCVKRAIRAAQYKKDVILLGETGTGKDVLAGLIYEQSRFFRSGLEIVDCTTLDQNLFLSTLFGHKKGSFTGAIGDNAGRLALADEGTIFLDEIGELSLENQAKLLRFLQNRTFCPIGGNKTVRVNARIIMATNQDIKKMTREGRMRKDLYFRIRQEVIEIPPLRERIDDIELLAEYFVRRFAVENEIDSRIMISNDFLGKLKDYSWPGNVRELKYVIESAAIEAIDDENVIKSHFFSLDMDEDSWT